MAEAMTSKTGGSVEFYTTHEVLGAVATEYKGLVVVNKARD